MDIKPINTYYRGYKFRSRLEARWAVFFDSIGIKWEYEKEGFELKDGTKYLPDFWLIDVQMWAEVKAIDFNKKEIEKAIGLAKGTKHSVLMLIGIPEFKSYYAINWEDGFISSDYVLSSYHNYPKDEGIFYSMPSDEDFECGMFDDTKYAINKSKSKRFEFEDGMEFV